MVKTIIYRGSGNVRIEPDVGCVLIEKDQPSPTIAEIPPSRERSIDIVLKDARGDADQNPITPLFVAGDRADGSTGAEYKIASAYGWIRLRPRPDGKGYVVLGYQL